MPQKSSKKDHKGSRHAATEGGSRWHKLHFSGKVIACSCLLGFMLILVGGILYALGQDEDEGPKPDQYDDVRKRPPMVYVGPVLMGIGVFIVIVGILMCLFETNVCRKRSPDASPLINAEAGQVEVKDTEGSASGYEPLQSSPRHKHKKGGGKKSKKAKGSKKPYANSEKIQVAGASADKETSKNFLTASDKFLTPPSSFRLEAPVGPSGMDSQVNKAMLQSLTSSGKSWNTSAEFQTPPGSFADDPMTKYMGNKEESAENNHEFLSPMPSNASILSGSSINEGDDGSLLDIDSKHEFLTPKNSNASVLSEEPSSNISPYTPIPNDPQIIQAEINGTEITPVLPVETQAEINGTEITPVLPVETQAEINVTTITPVLPEETQVEINGTAITPVLTVETQAEINVTETTPVLPVETRAESSSSVEKLEVSSEKINEEISINSPVEESQPAVVSTESVDLLTNDSKESSGDDSKTLQGDSEVDLSNKEVHDEKTDSATEKENPDLINILE